jgi:phenol 2-monooxygenase
LTRVNRKAYTPHGISHFQAHSLHQGSIEQILLDSIEENSKLCVERGAVPEKLDIEALKDSEVADDAYPIIVTLRHLAETDLAPAHNMGIANGLYRSNIAKNDTDDLIHKSEKNNYIMETVKSKIRSRL